MDRTRLAGALGRFLYLQPGELERLIPFLGFYLLLFSMLAIGDGLSLALFVQRVGVSKLPEYYGFTALANFVLVGLYILFADRISNLSLFRWILLLSIGMFLGSWVFIQANGGSLVWYGLFFISREISFTIVLMHFGTFLQDYFTRSELNRVLPVIYSGGRLGGMLGGVLLGLLSTVLGLLNMVLVYIGIGLLCLVVLWRMGGFKRIAEPSPAQSEEVSSNGLPGFLKFLRQSPLLFWFSVSMLLFVVCRWILNYEYNSFFERHFHSETQMAQFLGWYTSLAMLLSLLIQLFLMNRLVAWIGIKGCYLLYSLLLLLGMGLNLLPMTFAMAIFSRLMETELRTGMRNPITMLITNQFAKAQRTRARAWSMGFIVPLATLASSLLLISLERPNFAAWIPAAGFGICVLYCLSMIGLFRSFTDDGKQAFRKSD